ncbi:C-type lectin 6 [Aphelenchoides avenae]|nr:C-type lectin 6 [Aphelenchus avenae]
MTLLVVLYVASACWFMATALCPLGSVQGVSPNDCYFYKLNPRLWFDAQEDCTKLGGALTSVHSAAVNSFLASVMDIKCYDRMWLGGTTLLTGNWSWADGSRFDFTNWAAGQPSSTGALCISLDIASSKWYSDSCMVAKPYICKVSPRPITPAPTLKPATRPASTTRRIPTTTADRAFHPCQQRVAIVFDASNSLTTADFQKQKNFLRNALFAANWNHFERLGLAVYANGVRKAKDFKSMNSLSDVQSFIDAAQYAPSATTSLRKTFSQLGKSFDGNGNTFGGTNYSTIVFVSRANAQDVSAAVDGAWTLSEFGRVTIVALKGVDKYALEPLANNIIEWDLKSNAPLNWQDQFNAAYNCPTR